MKPRFSIAAGVPLAFLCGPVIAAEFAPLPTIVITPGRVAQRTADSLASVTVIDRAQIERQQATSVPDLLQAVQGITVANSGGPGKQTSLFLRGTESDQVLVLIDGVKVGSATAGTTPFEHLPVEQIERIEIVRGPRSSLYGSEAIGGVIQIFTRKGGGGLRPSFSLGAGRYDTYKGALALSGGGENAWYNAGVSGIDTNGFNACNGDPVSFAGCATDEPDKDGYRNWSGNLRAGYRFANATEVDAHWLRVAADTEFDGSFQNESETLQQVVGVGLEARPNDRWRVRLQGGRSWDELDTFKDGDFRTRFDTERDTASLQNDITIAEGHLLTLGLDYQEDRVSGTTDFTVDSRDNTGLFGQYLGNWGGHDLQLSLRHDDNEQFGGYETGGIAWGYPFAAGLRAFASFGTAFKAPNFNELYFPADPVFGGGGNPELDPEESRSVEIGLGATTAWGAWSLNAYQTDIQDLIVASFQTGFVPFNVAEARIRGLEAALDARLAGWELGANLTLLDPRDRDTDNLLPRRPEQSLRIDVDRRFARYGLGATLIGVGRRYDDLANTRRLDPYATVSLRGEYRIDAAWRLQARLDNLFDEDYETAAFYNQAGRSLFLTLRYQP